MPCDQSPDLIGAYLDGELSGPRRAAVARHLADCADCAALAADLRETNILVAGLGRELMPPSLALRLQNTLRQAPESRHTAQPLQGTNTRAITRRGVLDGRVGGFVRQAAVLLVACVLSSLSTWWLVSGHDNAAILTQDLLSAHLRSLLQDSPIQVASSDTHTVKPWFAGKVDVSPEVRDLAAEGFPLLGGRLDSIGGSRVAVLVYKRGPHLISVFAWPDPNSARSRAALAARGGYNFESRTHAGVNYVAVSDIEAAELRRLIDLL
ncbi:anti-sigma factor RsiW [Bosea sp. BE271]|uniref:anti-sigma factor family protein n=1 Tax=Bosea TaxID=85413 RepID=UPI00285C25AA|nr:MULTISPECIES: anti-sigma factor [Bosea]MDR6830761.1 anti-sigma factor RsiW [Bosea robiniae]MDR6895418.1 anti-sigma factor RsiW [Bosea sp. BE109]MDR7138814.1 anti-sigma factor RsiW [Bosea sp. BE168]MDR7175515.1 anti-sigma factor RsiW [Bosea sp. BE271]